MSISVGAWRGSPRRRALVTAVVAPLLLPSVGAVAQPANGSTAPRTVTVTATTAHPRVPAFRCPTLKNWLDHHPANTAEWRKDP
ncbi:hypothetical protein [Streptomyces sp. CT34]|uniref:hypothetical protein n=1 Tax=Streptomyces sp. CT34 TaxID=1553907 RepID=UPI0005BA8757|nr:hypothetical protein [Streptomyces sp. CT34]